jgi:hypothetical protein
MIKFTKFAQDISNQIRLGYLFGIWRWRAARRLAAAAACAVVWMFPGTFNSHNVLLERFLESQFTYNPVNSII